MTRSIPATLLLALTLLSPLNARAEEPPSAPCRLIGRVFEKGTISPLSNVQVSTTSATTVTDDKGHFSLDLAPGSVEVALSHEGHETLRITEKLTSGKALTVEYRLLPRDGAHRYESTIAGDSRHEGQRFALREDEMRKLPGSLGDPFRVVGALPGVGTPLPLLPVFVVRGASPSTNAFFLDGMRIPQLYHSLVGSSVIHPRLVEKIDFYPGAYDVTFGRAAGGIINAETHAARDTGYHGEVELRLFDVSALVELALPKDVRIEFGGHYGYPGPIVQAIDSAIQLNYWDYQFRLDWHGLTVEALGSWDDFGVSVPGLTDTFSALPNPIHLSFHRVQIRDREHVGPVEITAAIVGGYDEFSGNGSGVQKLSLQARLGLRYRRGWFHLESGVESEVSRFTPHDFGANDPNTAPVGGATPDELSELGEQRTGITGGGYLQGTAEAFSGRIAATVGVRTDVYHSGVVTLVGVDPRISLRARLLPQLSVTVGGGLYQQPPSLPLPLPGIDTFSLQLGLQRAWQGAVTFDLTLPQSFSASATGFYQRFFNMTDVLVDLGIEQCSVPIPPSLHGLLANLIRQVDGVAYGMELMVRRKVGRVTGWLSYTLSQSLRQFSCGLRPSDFDQTHILNAVVQAQLPWKLMAGARLSYSSGRPSTKVDIPDYLETRRNNVRLPDYVQLDVRIDREWVFQKWALSLFVEVLNLTYSQANYGINYPYDANNKPRYDQPQITGFRWMLPSIGLRGRF